MNYNSMAAHYDDIMILGQYYDYRAVAESIAKVADVDRVLEIGVGTGLVLEHLLGIRQDYEAVTGIDLSCDMLDIAKQRLAERPQVDLHEQNVVDLDLDLTYDLAFSYGGVWYFVPDGTSYSMISHMRSDADNAGALERVAQRLVPDGHLMLGVQGPHSDYSRELGNGTTYAQCLSPLDSGFRKEYRLSANDAPDEPLLHQVIDYRVYTFDEALELLAGCGLKPAALAPGDAPVFLDFVTA